MKKIATTILGAGLVLLCIGASTLQRQIISTTALSRQFNTNETAEEMRTLIGAPGTTNWSMAWITNSGHLTNWALVPTNSLRGGYLSDWELIPTNAIPTNSTYYTNFWANRNPDIVAVNFTNYIGGTAYDTDDFTEVHFLMTDGYSRIRQGGLIDHVEIVVTSTNNLTAFFFYIWREDGDGAWDRIYVENVLSKLAVGTNNVTLAEAVTCNVGDQIGVGYTASPASHCIQVYNFGLGGGIPYGCRIMVGSTPGSIVDWDGYIANRNFLPVRVFMQAPSMGFIGDSLFLGAPGNLMNWFRWQNSDGTNGAEKTFPYMVASNYNATYQCLGVGSFRTDEIYKWQMPVISNAHPRLLVMGSIVNDIYYNTGQSNYCWAITNMVDGARRAGMKVLFMKPTPHNSLSTNQMLQAEQWIDYIVPILTSTYGDTVIGVVDVRPYVGTRKGDWTNGPLATNLWAWNPSYNADPAHANVAGYARMARAICDYINTNASVFSTVVQGDLEVTGLHSTAPIHASYFSGDGGGLHDIPVSGVATLEATLRGLANQNPTLGTMDLLVNTNGTWLRFVDGSYVGKTNYALDNDTMAYIGRGSHSNMVEITAIDHLVTGLKAASLWANSDMIYLLRPGNRTNNLVNASGNLTFAGAGLDDTNFTTYGFKGNMSAYAFSEWGLTNLANYGQDDSSLMVYIKNTPTRDYAICGITELVAPIYQAAIGFYSGTNGPIGILNRAFPPFSGIPEGNLTNTWIVSRTNANYEFLYGGGRTNWINAASGGIPTGPFGVLAQGTPAGTPYYPGDALVSMLRVGASLQPDEAMTLSSLAQTYVDTLGLSSFNNLICGSVVAINNLESYGTTAVYGDATIAGNLTVSTNITAAGVSATDATVDNLTVNLGYTIDGDLTVKSNLNAYALVVTNLATIGNLMVPTNANIKTLVVTNLATIGNLTVPTNANINALYITDVPTNGIAPPTSLVSQPLGLFGSMMMKTTNSIAFSGAGAYSIVTNYSTVRTNGFIANAATGFLTNLVAGYYRINYYVSGFPGNSELIEGEVFVDNTGREEISMFGQYDNPARVRTISSTGILYLPANSGISFRIANESGTTAFTMWRGALTVSSP